MSSVAISRTTIDQANDLYINARKRYTELSQWHSPSPSYSGMNLVCTTRPLYLLHPYVLWHGRVTTPPTISGNTGLLKNRCEYFYFRSSGACNSVSSFYHLFRWGIYREVQTIWHFFRLLKLSINFYNLFKKKLLKERFYFRTGIILIERPNHSTRLFFQCYFVIRMCENVEARIPSFCLEFCSIRSDVQIRSYTWVLNQSSSYAFERFSFHVHLDWAWMSSR